MLVWTILAAAAATLCAALAYYYWRESSRHQTMLVEGANGYEELRRGYHELEKQLHDFREAEGKFAKQFESIESELDKSRLKAVDLASQLEIRDQQEQVKLEKLELQKGHLQKELARASQEADHFKNAATTMETELQDLRQGAKTWEQKKLEPLRQKLGESRGETKKVTSERDKLQRLVNTINPSEIKKVKRKLTQYGRLYASMKGLKEMSEERNRNYEVALEKLSSWILTQKQPGFSPGSKAVGPMVGEALQAIGEQLIDDGEQAFDPGAGADHSEQVQDKKTTQAKSADEAPTATDPGKPSAEATSPMAVQTTEPAESAVASNEGP